jgi:hypothetical protein
MERKLSVDRDCSRTSQATQYALEAFSWEGIKAYAKTLRMTLPSTFLRQR